MKADFVNAHGVDFAFDGEENVRRADSRRMEDGDLARFLLDVEAGASVGDILSGANVAREIAVLPDRNDETRRAWDRAFDFRAAPTRQKTAIEMPTGLKRQAAFSPIIGLLEVVGGNAIGVGEVDDVVFRSVSSCGVDGGEFALVDLDVEFVGGELCDLQELLIVIPVLVESDEVEDVAGEAALHAVKGVGAFGRLVDADAGTGRAGAVAAQGADDAAVFIGRIEIAPVSADCRFEIVSQHGCSLP